MIFSSRCASRRRGREGGSSRPPTPWRCSMSCFPLAELAHERNYAVPEIDDGGELVIIEGRHPVIEAMRLGSASFPTTC